ncbi:MAG TPA: regulatory protein RecX [Lachnospiraceae bacterium]|nr:regulatory protein RecX [Lachnospiraceae bacterium]HPF29892.1 regulatory protein RecX [Lachnospiraceae bacterium]
MQITQIQLLNKKRYKVYIDGAIAFVLYKGDLLHYELRETKEISQEMIDRIVEEVLCKRASNRLLYLLQKKDYTEYQLREKLRDGYYPQQAIDAAISSMSQYGYLNDERYTARYIEFHMENKSYREIQMSLMRRGISQEKIKATTEQLAEDGIEQDTQGMILRLLDKRHYHPQTAEQKETEKQVNYLLRKGFGIRDIKQALKTIGNQWNSDEDT